MSVPLITFLSDYGSLDEFVGVCHGMIARRCPTARVIDITHGIPPQDIRAGALVLADALAYMPPGVHLAVVDPGVGAEGAAARRPLALRAAEQQRLLVGPDNGLLTLAAERFGGVTEAIDIGGSRERLQPLSHTFHGRDLFAPVAAALAAGEPFEQLGEQVSPDELCRLEFPLACVVEGVLSAHVLRADHFGNVILDASLDQLAEIGAQPGEPLSVRIAGRVFPARRTSTFAEVRPGELLLYADATGRTALAVNHGSAAELLGVERDDELLVRRA